MQLIPTAILSYGMSGRIFHAPFIHAHPGFQLTGAWERSKKTIRERYPEVTSYDSFEEILNDTAIELVVVNTPTNTHFDYARQCLNAGKHVVVEKAFTTTAAEAWELRTLEKSVGRKISVFQNRRWDSDFKTVQDIVNRKLLGDMVEATISFDRYNPGLSPKLHKETPGPGAGVMKDLGPHLIDQALCLFGMPLSVFADLRTTRRGSTVDDYFEILLYYHNLRVRLKSGYFVREAPPAYIFHGTQGSFLKVRGDVQEAQLGKGMKPGDAGYGVENESQQGLLHTELDGIVVKEKISTLPGNYMEYYNAVYLAISGNSDMPVTAEDGMRVMQIIDAASASHEARRVVDF